MKLENMSVYKMKKRLLKTKDKEEKILLENRINKELKEIEKFTDNLFKSQIYRLACTEIMRRRIRNPNFADLLQMISEINATAQDKNIDF